MKSLQRFFLCFALFVALASSIRSAAGAQAYIIVDATTGAILDAEEPAQKRQIGSLTKIATAMVVLDWAEHRSGDLNQIATVQSE
ncbi:MAG: hypothetical protein ACREIW_12545, partial [Chthoniobacterales bacterium]